MSRVDLVIRRMKPIGELLLIQFLLLALSIFPSNLYADSYPGAFRDKRVLYTNSENDDSPEQPRIAGDHVVWASDWAVNDGIDVLLFRLNPAQGQAALTNISNSLGDQDGPEISQDYVIWNDDRAGKPGIWRFRLSDSSKAGVPPSQEEDSLAMISGTKAAWAGLRGSNFDNHIFWKTIGASGVNDFLLPNEDIVNGLGMDGNIIAWENIEFINDGIKSSLFALVDGNLRVIADAPGSQRNPVVKNGLIAWEDSRNSTLDGIDIYIWDAINGERKLIGGSGNQKSPRLTSNGVLYNSCPSSLCELRYREWNGSDRGLAYEENAIYGIDADIENNRVVWVGESDSGDDEVNYGVINSEPRFANMAPQSIARGSTLQFTISATDPDDSVLTYLAVTILPGATFNPSTRVFSWPVPMTQTPRIYPARFRVFDPLGATTEMTVPITVLNSIIVSASPVITVTQPINGGDWYDGGPHCPRYPADMRIAGTVTTAPGTTLSSLSISMWETDFLGTEHFIGAPAIPFSVSGQNASWSICVGTSFMDAQWRGEITAQSNPPAVNPGKRTISIDVNGRVTVCHVLTAAFGRPDAPVIRQLWQLHQKLVTNWNAPWHQSYMHWYDQVGPKIASWLENKPLLKALIRKIASAVAHVATGYL